MGSHAPRSLLVQSLRCWRYALNRAPRNSSGQTSLRQLDGATVVGEVIRHCESAGRESTASKWEASSGISDSEGWHLSAPAGISGPVLNRCLCGGSQSGLKDPALSRCDGAFLSPAQRELKELLDLSRTSALDLGELAWCSSSRRFVTGTVDVNEIDKLSEPAKSGAAGTDSLHQFVQECSRTSEEVDFECSSVKKKRKKKMSKHKQRKLRRRDRHKS